MPYFLDVVWPSKIHHHQTDTSTHSWFYISNTCTSVLLDNNNNNNNKIFTLLFRNVILSCADSLWAVKLHWLDKFLLYTVTDKNMAFLVHNYCWATDGNNGKSITADVTDYTFENIQNDACFSYFPTIWQLFWTFLILQDKHNIGTLLLNIKFICTCFSTCF